MHAPLLKDMAQPEWIELLKAQVARGRTISAVAAEIGMTRSALSMLLSGSYPARLDRISRKYAAKAVALYAEGILCPYLRRILPPSECRAHAAAPMSTANPDRLRQWIACRDCPLNPVTGGQP